MPESCFVRTVCMLESDYIHAASPKPPPPIPVRVFRRSQLRAGLRQHARPIVIEYTCCERKPPHELSCPLSRAIASAVYRPCLSACLCKSRPVE
jgi:hypothetical protein